MDTNKLAMEIAAYRQMMNKLSKGKSLTDPDVILLRQGLDTMICNYFFELRPQCRIRWSNESFDVIVSRNVTWLMPNPLDVYKEW